MQFIRWLFRTVLQAQWVTAIAAVVYTVGALLTLKAINEGNELVRKNNIVSQRAFVSVAVKPGLVSFQSGLDKLSTEAVLGSIKLGYSSIAGLNFVVEMTNSGNTGTKNLTFFIKCATSTEDLQEPWALLYQSQQAPQRGPQFIGPHATIQSTCGFPFEQIMTMGTAKLFGYIMADVPYQDRFSDKWHQTQTTMKVYQVGLAQMNGPGGLNVGGSIQLAVYGRHNCADEECPPK